MADDSFTFAGADGAPIFTYRWMPSGPVRGVLQIAHGMGEHALRYRAPLQPLLDAGIAIYANDHRGHGRTAPSKDALGAFPGGFEALVDDMAVLSRRIRTDHPGKKLILMGHSMGSFAAQIYVVDYSSLIDGFVLSGSAALDLLQAPRGGLSAIGEGMAKPRTPFDWLSRDDKEVDAYIADPLCGFTVNDEARASMFSAAAKALDPKALAHIRKNLPFYIFAGDEDPINAKLTRLLPLVERYREAGISDITTDFYSGGRHEMLNETNRDEVVANLKTWIERVIA